METGANFFVCSNSKSIKNKYIRLEYIEFKRMIEALDSPETEIANLVTTEDYQMMNSITMRINSVNIFPLIVSMMIRLGH